MIVAILLNCQFNNRRAEGDVLRVCTIDRHLRRPQKKSVVIFACVIIWGFVGVCGAVE